MTLSIQIELTRELFGRSKDRLGKEVIQLDVNRVEIMPFEPPLSTLSQLS